MRRLFTYAAVFFLGFVLGLQVVSLALTKWKPFLADYRGKIERGLERPRIPKTGILTVELIEARAVYFTVRQRRVDRLYHRWQDIRAEELAALVPAAPAPAPGPVYDGGPINWLAIADCESGDGNGLPPYTPDWSYNGPSGYDGGLQFLPSTWIGAGGGQYAPYAYLATASEQIAVASTLALRNWPYCQRYA